MSMSRPAQTVSSSMKTASTKTVVIQSALTFPWLGQTKTWLFNQVHFLPPDIESHVVCERTENLDQFAVPHLHALVASSDDGGGWRWQAYRGLIKLGLRPGLQRRFLTQMARTHHATVLHSHFGNAAWRNLAAAKAAGLRHVVTFYGYDVNMLPQQEPAWRTRYAELFAEVDAVLCEGPYMGQSIAALGCPAVKIHVHHLGIGVDSIAFRPRRHPGKAALRVLLAASFTEKKGFPYALEALGRFQHEHPVAITIIGDAGAELRQQQEKARILAVLARHGLDGKARLLGYQPYPVIFQEAYNHHLFMAPSVTAQDGDTEGGAPVTIIEMAATGMQLIATTHCDIPAVIAHGEAGLLAPERDVDGLLAQLQRLVADDQAAWDARAHAARQHVEAEYAAPLQGARLAAIYRRLAER